jgi:hypothetical protein
MLEAKLLAKSPPATGFSSQCPGLQRVRALLWGIETIFNVPPWSNEACVALCRGQNDRVAGPTLIEYNIAPCKSCRPPPQNIFPIPA